MRLGIFVTHPIQYYTPWFRDLARCMDVQVYYAHRQAAQDHGQAGFGVSFEWDTPLLEGYHYQWLTNIARRPDVTTFAGCNTPEIYKVVRQQHFDAFLVFGWGHKSALQTIHACWCEGIPVLMRGDSQLTTRRSRFKAMVKYVPYRWFLPRLAAHLYVGQRNKAYLQHYGVGNDQLFFAPHFVDNAFFMKRTQEVVAATLHLELRDSLCIPRDAFVSLYVGKFTAIKRPDDFVKAMVGLCQHSDGANMYAIVVGDGPMRQHLHSLAYPIAERIRFVGFHNQTELPLFYRAADVLVLPGDETWGLVVNEAMACGRPAIVSEAAGCAPDLIVEGQTGFTYPLGDIELLAQRILELRRLRKKSPVIIAQLVTEKIAHYSIGQATNGLKQALVVVMNAKTHSAKLRL